MPTHYDTHYEDTEQDWDTVVLKSSNVLTNNKNTQNIDIPLFRKIRNARSQYGYTAHELCQQLHMKFKTYQKMENGEIPVPPECIPKLRKLLHLKL